MHHHLHERGFVGPAGAGPAGASKAGAGGEDVNSSGHGNAVAQKLLDKKSKGVKKKQNKVKKKDREDQLENIRRLAESTPKTDFMAW